MLVSESRIGLDELRRHNQVQGNAVGVFLLERLQLIAGNPVEVGRHNAVGDCRSVVVRTNRADAERIAVLGQLTLTRIEVAAGRGALRRPEALLIRLRTIRSPALGMGARCTVARRTIIARRASAVTLGTVITGRTGAIARGTVVAWRTGTVTLRTIVTGRTGTITQ